MSKKQEPRKIGRKFRPSNADRYLNCPASVVASADMEEDGGTVYSDAGTVAHALAELCLETGTVAKDHIGKKLCEGEGNHIEVDSEMAVNVQSYLDYIEKQGFSQCWVERELQYPWIDNPDGELTTGKADFIGYNEDFNELVVLDYKNGVMTVPDDSYQFGCYAYPLLFDEDSPYKDLDEVTAGRYQPNAMGSPIGSHVWDRKSLSILKQDIQARTHWVSKTKPEDLTDEDYEEGHWCKFCPNKHQCPAKVSTLFDTVDMVTTDQDDSLPAPSTLTSEQIRLVLDKRKEIKQWLDDVYNHQLAQAMRGQPLEGMKLVEGRAKPRAWKKNLTEADLVEGMVKAGLMKDECYQDPKMITPATAKKLLKGTDKFEELLDPSSKSLELVPEGDKRKVFEPVLFPTETE